MGVVKDGIMKIAFVNDLFLVELSNGKETRIFQTYQENWLDFLGDVFAYFHRNDPFIITEVYELVTTPKA